MTTSIYSHVAKWIKKISIVHDVEMTIQYMSICQKSKMHIVQSRLDVDPDLIKKQVCIFVVPDSISKTKLNNYCKKLKNSIRIIFVTDHKKQILKLRILDGMENII